jgi:hypothetical protein
VQTWSDLVGDTEIGPQHHENRRTKIMVLTDGHGTSVGVEIAPGSFELEAIKMK